jgi:hypothetical protein
MVRACNEESMLAFLEDILSRFEAEFSEKNVVYQDGQGLAPRFMSADYATCLPAVNDVAGILEYFT